MFMLLYSPKLYHSSLCLELIGTHQLHLTDIYIRYISATLLNIVQRITMTIYTSLYVGGQLHTALLSQHAAI